MASRVKVNYVGVGQVLKGEACARMVADAAEAVAANVPTEIDGEMVTTSVYAYTTDRASASVVMEHAIAAAFQAKYGTLTQAAGAAGFEVSSG